MIDTHIHFTHPLFDGIVPCLDVKAEEYTSYWTREELLEKLQAEGITAFLEPGIDAASNEKILQLCHAYPNKIYAALGVHPTRCIHTPFRFRKKLRELAKDPAVVAIGETGLDYHYPRKEQHRLRQMLWFYAHIQLAHALGLPLILHIRDANDDAIRVLRRNKKKLHGGIVHCFQGGEKEAKIYTEELGLYLGIGGALLQKNSEMLEASIRAVPFTTLVLETDGPFVKPQTPDDMKQKKWRKLRNNSLILPLVAREIARIKDTSIEEVESVTDTNVTQLMLCVKNYVTRTDDKV